MNRSLPLLILAASALALVGAAAAQGTTGSGATGAYPATVHLTEACGDLATSTNGTRGGTGATGAGCMSPASLRVPTGYTAVRLTLMNNGTGDLRVDVCDAGTGASGSSYAACPTTGAGTTTNGTGSGTSGSAGTTACDGAGTGTNATAGDLESLPATVPGGDSGVVCVTLRGGDALRLVLADSGALLGTLTQAATGTGGTGTTGGNATNDTNDTTGGEEEATGDNDAPGPGVLLALGVALVALTLRRKE